MEWRLGTEDMVVNRTANSGSYRTYILVEEADKKQINEETCL